MISRSMMAGGRKIVPASFPSPPSCGDLGPTSPSASPPRQGFPHKHRHQDWRHLLHRQQRPGDVAKKTRPAPHLLSCIGSLWQLGQRRGDFRPTWKLKQTEEVAGCLFSRAERLGFWTCSFSPAGNYFPVTTSLYIRLRLCEEAGKGGCSRAAWVVFCLRDTAAQLTVLTDVAQELKLGRTRVPFVSSPA